MIVGFMPIRAGSKGVPHKNIRVIHDKPLFHHVILEALKVSGLEEVWISTESKHYASLVPEGVKVHMRPQELAEDHVPTAPVIVEFLEKHPHVSTVVLLEATSPTVTAKDIEESLRLSEGGKGCVSVQPSHAHLYKGNEPIWITRTVRQKVETYEADGGIFVIHREDFLKTKTIPTYPCNIMVLPHPVCDIDTEKDLDDAEAVLSEMFTAYLDIDETYVNMKGYKYTEEWSTPTLCLSENQLKEFILEKIRHRDENEIHIFIDGSVREDETQYIVMDASEKIPFLKGASFPKNLDGKVIKMLHDGDSAISALVRKNNIQEKNILLLIFGTEIKSGLYIHRKLVKNSKVGKLLGVEYSTNLENSDPMKLVRELAKIKTMLSLEDVYVSGDILKYENFVRILRENGIRFADSYLNICKEEQTAQKKQ